MDRVSDKLFNCDHCGGTWAHPWGTGMLLLGHFPFILPLVASTELPLVKSSPTKSSCSIALLDGLLLSLKRRYPPTQFHLLRSCQRPWHLREVVTHIGPEYGIQFKAFCAQAVRGVQERWGTACLLNGLLFPHEARPQEKQKCRVWTGGKSPGITARNLGPSLPCGLPH